MRKEGMKSTVAAAALTVVVAACGTGATTTTEAPTTQPAPAENVVEIAMSDFAFGNLPAEVPAGTRLTVVNNADSELHEVVVFKLPDGETRSAAELSQLPPQELEHAFGGPPVAVLIAAPGGPQIPAVGDGVLAEPGNYVVFCFIPTGVEVQVYLDAAAESEGAPQIEGAGPPHFIHGMFADLTVR